MTLTAELPGRTFASLSAEIRPQVGGIVLERVFREGAEVRAGDVLYRIDPATYRAALESAEAALQKAEASVPSAQAKVERYQRLLPQNAVSRQELDDAVAALAQARAEVGTARANVRTAQINLDNTSLRAPISGRIDRSTVTPGALVTANQTTALATIRSLDPINVDVTASSTRLLAFRQAIAQGRIRMSDGQTEVRLKLEDGTFYPQPGRLAFTEANVNESTGTVTTRIEFPNPDRLLLPGMYVRAVVEEGVTDTGFVVPQRAVTRNAMGQPTVLVVGSDGVVAQRTLSVARSVRNGWLVESGLAEGDRVVIEGLQRAVVGQAVAAVEVVVDETSGEVRNVSDAAPAPASGRN